MIRIVEVAEIVDACTYKPGWHICLRADPMQSQPDHPSQMRYFIQLEVDATARAAVGSVAPHDVEPWKSGKRYISLHMCRQEIVGVIFDLIKGAEDHELREWFRYQGAAIYNPHLDPDVLAEVARRKASFVMRDNAMNMKEGP